MRYFTLPVWVIVSTMTLALLTQPNTADAFEDYTAVELKQLIDSGQQLFLLNPLSEIEFKEGHIPGSVNIPLPLIQQALKQLDRATPVLLYCNSGQRSGMAKQLLDASGFTVVHNLGSYTCLNSVA